MNARRPREGFELALLLLTGFRALIDQLHAELAERGHPDARPVHGFALQAIGPGGVTVSELGRRLGVSRQAAMKTAANLVELDYATRNDDPDDRRIVVITRTAHGEEFLAMSAEVFNALRADWEAAIGRDRLADLEDALELVTSPAGVRLDLPGWLT